MPASRKQSSGRPAHSPVGPNNPTRRLTERPRTVRRFARGRAGEPDETPPKLAADLRVLALDSSSKACGWSVFDNGKLLAYGHFKQQGVSHAERLVWFREWLLKMYEQWTPDEVVYEVPFQGRTSHAFGVLIRYVAIIELTHFEWFGKEVPEANAIVAHAVKKAIKAPKPTTGKKHKAGNNTVHDANKRIVILMVNQEFGLNLKYKSNDTNKTVSQDDDADAIALNWAWHIRKARGEK